ncbi:potassium channel family protein [Neobacillus cucumis]|uniref:ion channel n=1 Tax=Neobacillus cucumis TaxID=1740721 RepID=UPI002041589A|nr:ion channel [Neobacillus cucumis]MCM3726975.1 potassium channel family protein [Neobacillus cucumis]
MKTVLGKLNKVAYYYLMIILLLGLLFFNELEKRSVYILFGFVLILFSFTIWLLFQRLKQIPRSTEHLVIIFFCIGLLIFCIILSYANFYHLIYELRGKLAFRGSSLHANDFIYYSITTFTTTGYGDITSVGLISNMIAASEMLMGYTISTVIMGVIATKVYQTNESK